MKLRQLFENEALDFTPWLAKNNLIPDIMHSLNLFENPSIFKTEVTISDDYRLDMLYKSSTGSFIVENQYGRSDSKHLGQILVYSQLTHIPTVLWICESVGLEHRRISEILQGIHIIPVSFEFIEGNWWYTLKVHVYDEYNKILVYRIDKDLKVVGRILEG